MSEKQGTYASLVELQEAKSQVSDQRGQSSERGVGHTRPELPPELDDLTEAGYRSHSFRFTTDESRWLKNRCLQLSAQLDRTITHNELVRVLLRIADDAMKASPDKNDVLDRLGRIKD